MVKPGARLMLQYDMDAGTAAILYEEGKLQARIDVPLNEVSKINLDSPLKLHHLYFAKVFPGKVTRILGEADLQRNTLQVKVRNEPRSKTSARNVMQGKIFRSAVPPIQRKNR